MKPIKIFALPSHASKKNTSGVDFARIIQPMKYLNLHKDFDVTIWDVHEPEISTWDKLAPQYDIFYFNYMNTPWGFAAMGCMARKNGVKLVMDLDDSLWHILPDNPAYKIFKKKSKGIHVITSICNESDFITCTHGYLKNVITHNTFKSHEDIEVLPNFIDLDLYKHRAKVKNEHNIIIGHVGSTTHFTSLMSEGFLKGMDKIMKEYPNVTFKTIGAFIPKYKKRWGARYMHAFGDTDLYKWVNDKFPEATDDIDFFVTPLVDNVYNRCKSNIKFLEISSAKKPGVWQNIRQYSDVVRNGITGLLAERELEWYGQMKKLITNVKLRKEMGENAFEQTKENWTIQSNINYYADFFKKVALDKRNSLL